MVECALWHDPATRSTRSVTVILRFLRWNARCGTRMRDGLAFAVAVLHCQPFARRPALIGFEPPHQRHSNWRAPRALCSRIMPLCHAFMQAPFCDKLDKLKRKTGEEKKASGDDQRKEDQRTRNDE